MMRTVAFVLLQTALLVATTQAQQVDQLLECTPELVEEFDFTYDGHLGKVEFIQLLEELAPPTCNVVEIYQTRDTFQSALQQLSCLCTDFGGASDPSCCNGSSFAVQGHYDEAYDHAVCEHIERLVRDECFQEEEEAPAEESSKPHFSALRHHQSAEAKSSEWTAATPEETSTIDVSVGIFSTALLLILCVMLLLQTLSSLSTIDAQAAQKRHGKLLTQQTQIHDASMEITSTTPYVQIV